LTSKSSQIGLNNEKYQLSVSDLKSKLDERERQIGELRGLISQVDKERDGFQNDLDSKAELIVQLESFSFFTTDNLLTLSKLNKTQEIDNVQLHGQLETLELHLNNQDAETRRLSNQLEEAIRSKNQFQQSSHVRSFLCRNIMKSHKI
jgi:chromosome segregation ATPase